jgi:tight adherence protein C
MLDIILIALLAGASCGLLVLALIRSRERQSERRKMRDRALGIVGAESRASTSQQGLGNWLSGAVKGVATRFGEAIKPKEASELDKTRASLMHAGFRQPNALEIYWGIKAGAALVGLVIGGLVALSGRMPGQYKMVAVLFCVAAVFYLPGIMLDSQVKKRQKAVQRALPDALDLLVVCVEAGMGLDAAMYRVCLDLSPREPVLGSELRQLTLELRAGKSRREALKNLSTRIGLEDVGSLVAMLIQADMFGTSIAQTLRVYADAMRTKRFQRAEELAAKLPVKLLFPLVFFIFPTLLIVILGPAAIRLMQMFGGIKH